MKLGATKHPKIEMLADQLEITGYAAVGLVECLYQWASQYAPDGHIGRWPDRTIAQGIGWNGTPSDLISALIFNQFIEVIDDDDRYMITRDDNFFDDLATYGQEGTDMLIPEMENRI